MTRTRVVPVLLAAVLVVGAANLGAFAANGGPLVLGKSNTASKATKLKNTGNGAALFLKSDSAVPPLKVSNSTKVTKLNADLVDGLEGNALKTKSFVYSLTPGTFNDDYVNYALPGLPPGRYQVSFFVTAIISGGSNPYFACYVMTGTGLALSSPAFTSTYETGGAFAVSGSGYVDTTSATYRMLCQKSNGTSLQIPAAPNYPPTVTFTRIDDATVASTSGTDTSAPRSGVLR
jgi:hypothetical protein